jgi:hypothetical protein
MGSAAANAASVRGASSMCQVTINGAGPSMVVVGGSAVNGTPAAVPVIVSMHPPAVFLVPR